METSSSSSSSSPSDSRDWSNGLPSDVMGEIMSRFTSCGDRIHFAAVSKPWREFAISRNGRPSHPPWLVIPQLSEAYSFSDQRRYSYNLQLIHDPEHHLGADCRPCIVVGSGIGWIVIDKNADGGSTHQLQLIHFGSPITTHLLPPITATTPQHKENDTTAFYNKAVFFPSASLIFLIYDSHCRIAFARVGGGYYAWTECSVELGRQGKEFLWINDFVDVVFHKGRFYALLGSGQIMALVNMNLSSTSSSSSSSAPPTWKCVVRPPPRSMMYASEGLEEKRLASAKKDKVLFVQVSAYMVEVESELMVVYRYKSSKSYNLDDDFSGRRRLPTNLFSVLKCCNLK